MNLPQIILTYAASILKTRVYDAVSLSLVSNKSHDSFTRCLVKKYGWKAVLYSFLKDIGEKYYVVVDETDHDKRYGSIFQKAYWFHSHKENRAIFGYQIIALAITDGIKTFPIIWRIYDPDNGKSKQDLAMEMMIEVLSEGYKPEAFLFDSLYASERILKFLGSRNQYYYTQIPKNRLFNGKQLKMHNSNRPYWMDKGYIKGRIEVQIVKNRKKYFMTNALDCTREKQLAIYRIRWKIEEMFRSCKSNFGMGKCQSRSLRSQHNHIGICFTLYCILQVMSQKTGTSDYAIKRKATFDHSYADSIINSMFPAYA